MLGHVTCRMCSLKTIFRSDPYHATSSPLPRRSSPAATAGWRGRAATVTSEKVLLGLFAGGGETCAAAAGMADAPSAPARATSGRRAAPADRRRSTGAGEGSTGASFRTPTRRGRAGAAARRRPRAPHPVASPAQARQLRRLESSTAWSSRLHLKVCGTAVTCFTPCLVNVPMAWAKPRPTHGSPATHSPARPRWHWPTTAPVWHLMHPLILQSIKSRRKPLDTPVVP